MASPSDILGYMSAEADERVDSITSSIGQVEEQIDVTLEEIDGVENGLCGVAETDMSDYLNTTKLDEIKAAYPAVPGTLGECYIVYGGTYGSIAWSSPGPVGNITDWEYRQDNLVIPPLPAPPVPSPAYYVRYVYTPGDDTTIDKLVTDYEFGNDYLTRPLTSGASYGLYDNLSGLQSAQSLLTADKNKIAASKTIFEDYK